MLELKHIRFDVDDDTGHVDILKDVSFSIPKNRFVVITGPNGGGKSTIAKVIAGVRMPSGGQIIFNGQDITALGITERAKLGISYALQQPVRFKGIQVIDLLRIAAGKDLTPAACCDYLAQVGLCARDYINREINASLSGGELKRIEIASVLARGSLLSVFDEPEAGIDLWSFRNLTEVFKRMREEIRDSSILIISHQERILSIADEIILIRDGRVEKQGTREDIYPGLMKAGDAETVCEGPFRAQGKGV